MNHSLFCGLFLFCVMIGSARAAEGGKSAGAAYAELVKNRDFQRAENALSATYEKLKRSIEEDPQNPLMSLKRLQDSQRQWVAWRNLAVQKTPDSKRAQAAVEITKWRERELNGFFAKLRKGDHALRVPGNKTEIPNKKGDGRPLRISDIERGGSAREKFAYEFLAVPVHPTVSLSSDSSGLILFADEKWVVRASEIARTGEERAVKRKTELRFYSARSGKLAAVVSVPNRVFRVGAVPSDIDDLFCIGTVTASEDRYDDCPLALVLIDLKKRVLERIRLVAADHGLALRHSVEILVSNPKILLRVDSEVFDRYVTEQPKTAPFKHLQIALQKSGGPQREPDPLRQNWERHVSLLKQDHPGLSYLGAAPVLAREVFSLGESCSLGGAQANGGLSKFLKVEGTGRAMLLDFPTLRSRAKIPDSQGAFYPHVFKDGSCSVVAGSQLFVWKEGVQRAVDFPDFDQPGFGRFILPENHSVRGGGSLKALPPVASISREVKELDGARQLIFSGDRVGYRSGNHLYQISLDRPGAFEEVPWSAGVKTLLGQHPANRIVDWNLQHEMCVLQFGGPDAAGLFQRVDVQSGHQIGSPWSGGEQGEFGGLRVSNVSQGWRAVSHANDSPPGAAASCVLLEEVEAPNRIVVAENLRQNADPLAVKHSDGQAQVLFGAAGWVQLAKVDVTTQRVRAVKNWSFESRYGEALFDSESGHLFLPNASGFEVWRAWEPVPSEKSFDLLLESGGGYCLVLPGGLFAGSPGCERLLAARAGNGTVDGSVLAPWRYRPAQVLKALGGDASQCEVLDKITERWLQKLGNPAKLPAPTAAEVPSLVLTSEVPLWAKTDSVALRFETKPGKAPVRAVVVRVNGVDPRNGANAVESKGSVYRTVKLAAGQNWIEAVAIDDKGRSSNPVRIRCILRETARPVRRFIVALGVSQHRDGTLNREFAAKDAADVAEVLKKTSPGPAAVLLLSDTQVQKDVTEKIRVFLSKASESDEVIAFCAGQGVLHNGQQYVFAGHDFDPLDPGGTGVHLDDLLEALGSAKALKRLLLLDTCHAGQAEERGQLQWDPLRSNLPEGVRMVVRHGAGIRSGAPRAEEVCRRHIESLFLCPGTLRGIHVLGTSGAAEFGLESEATKNGVFASSIREALLEKKADFNGDTRVSVVEMRDYVGQRVFELTRGAQSEGVTAFEPDQNFDLVAPPGKRSVGLIHSTVVPDRPLERSGQDAVRTADPKREGAAESF